MKFGIVGTSFWAETVHLAGLRACAEAELVGIWGRSAEKAANLADRLGITAFRSYEDMLANVDAVTIAVSPEAQPPLAIAAAEAGKHIIVEKPLAIEAQAAARIAEIVRRNDLASIVFFTRRFMPDIEALISAASRLKWRSGLIEIHSDAMRASSPYSNSLWRQQPDAALWDIGPHAVSVLLPILGSVKQVSARRRANTVILDTVHEGAEATISLTLHAATSERRRNFSFSGPSGPMTLPVPICSSAEAFSIAVRQLIATARKESASSLCDADFGLQVTLALEACQKSLLSAKPVDVMPLRLKF